MPTRDSVPPTLAKYAVIITHVPVINSMMIVTRAARFYVARS